ncbi:hypothetical protein [Candidatus Clostridium stratigraminis]|uniref:Uncharacterized protein n=1 Tax=Candidatus Clostridium stratigraminis TaxID=3381661 RepID=A0ABW8T8N8_9CLOT
MDKKIKVVTLAEAIKDMTSEELERFKKERYEKFIKPLMDMNMKELEKLNGK